jgi:hypothetical protein
MSRHVLPPKFRTIELLDHVLNKGIVIDASLRASLPSIDLLAADARVVVASIETYLANARTVAPASRRVATSAHMPGQVHRQLLHVQEQLERRYFARQQVRRFEDRVREERRDSQARTIAPAGP